MIVPFPKAVLFDFDGVVADSAHAHHTAWGAAYETIFDVPMGPFPKDVLAGKAPFLIAQHLATQGGDAEQTQRLYDYKLKLLLEGRPPRPLPGILSLMHLLQRENVPFGIASNAPGPFVRWSARHLSLPVEIVLGVEDFTKPKPAPDPYRQLAGRLGIAREDYAETWVLEDSLTGMRAAVAAEMFAIGITTQYTAEELEAVGAKITYAAPAGVAARLRSLLLLG